MSDKKEKLIILGRCGLKYTDTLGTEYFIDGEMIVSAEYDYVMWTDSIMYWKNHVKQSNPENIEYTEFLDEKSDTYHGQITYKKDFDSKLSNSKKQEIADRIRILSVRDNFKLEIL
jgi:hypothetical protein